MSLERLEFKWTFHNHLLFIDTKYFYPILPRCHFEILFTLEFLFVFTIDLGSQVLTTTWILSLSGKIQGLGPCYPPSTHAVPYWQKPKGPRAIQVEWNVQMSDDGREKGMHLRNVVTAHSRVIVILHCLWNNTFVDITNEYY